MKIELDHYFKGIGGLINEVETPHFSDALSELLRPVFNPQNMVLLIHDKESKPISLNRWVPNPKLRNVFDEYYFKIGYLMDPFCELTSSTFKDGPYLLRDIAPDRFFSQSDYYQEFYSKTKMIDELSCLAKIDKQKSVHLSLGRTEGNPKYKRKDLELLQSLSQVLNPLLVKHCFYRLRHGGINNTEDSQVSLKDQFYYANFNSNVRITKREAEIAALIVKGYSTTAIGLNLNISPQTVKVHRRNMYRKLNISSQAELFSFFIN